MKCANAPSIKTIRNRFPNSKFSSNHGTKYNMRKEIINRNGSKILQDSDILLKPLNIIDIFTDVCTQLLSFVWKMPSSDQF